jgi:simple sugar transport system ATP-binding protein
MIISTELDEVMELADRIAVLYKGKLVGIVPAGTGRDVLGLMMAGISPEDAARTDAAPGEKPPVAKGRTEPDIPETTQASTAEGSDHV